MNMLFSNSRTFEIEMKCNNLYEIRFIDNFSYSSDSVELNNNLRRKLSMSRYPAE